MDLAFETRIELVAFRHLQIGGESGANYRTGIATKPYSDMLQGRIYPGIIVSRVSGLGNCVLEMPSKPLHSKYRSEVQAG